METEGQDVATARPAPQPIRTPVSHAKEPSFTEILAAELQHAPWLLLSLLFHAALLLSLSLLPAPARLVDGLELKMQASEPATDSAGEDAPPEEPKADPEQDSAATERFDPAEEEAAAKVVNDDPTGDPFASSLLPWDDRGLRARIGGRRSGSGGNGTGLVDTEGGLPGGEGFKETVSRLRKSGLEIVFVVDSTGSMGGILRGAQQRIASMLEVLHVLVPDSRVGVLTYRDSGRSEDYLFRQVPLSRDHYRAASFVGTLAAKGGGDRDEAVYEALLETLKMKWSPAARRVIVLVGDAPPHAATDGAVLGRLRSFVSDGRSCIHAIVTSEEGALHLPKDTKAAFDKIAAAGKGMCIGFEDEELVMRQVLSLAFGHEYRRDIDQVYKLVEDKNRRIATYALDLVRGGDLKALDQELKKEPVDAEIIKAIVAQPRLEIAEHLVECMSSSTLPESGRQAAAWALKQILQVGYPLLDPERGGVLPANERKNVVELVRRKLFR